jgi:glycosyltransferase involved in cell wall biosynthesis
MFDDVLCLSHLRWGFVFQRPNHLMSRFARERRVFFVEEPVFGASSPRLDVQNHEGNGLHVVVPHLPHGMPHEDVESAQKKMLDDLVVTHEVQDPLLWVYTPMALGWARHVPSVATVYDCMDELALFHGAPPALREREKELFTRADVVFTGGVSLWEAKRNQHRNVHAMPSSVDAAHFAKAREGKNDPADQQEIPHPRVGFFGVIDERLDRELLESVARQRPHVHFVLLGPIVKIDPANLPKLPNIHYLGQKSYAELPAYLAGWDVAFMPFAINDATRFISPTKTPEFLAAGCPVVSTPIRDVVRPYGEKGLVRIAKTGEEMAKAIDAALAERGTPAGLERREACDAFVARMSWDQTWEAMRSHVTDAIRRRSRAIEATLELVQEEEAPCSTI